MVDYDISMLTYSQALEKLKVLGERMEQEALGLEGIEVAIAESDALIRRCTHLLRGVQEHAETIMSQWDNLEDLDNE